MKYLEMVSFFGLALFVLMGASSSALAKQECRILSVSAHPEAPPVMWKKGNKVEGIGVDIISTIAKNVGFKVDNPYKGPWKRVLKSLEMGQLGLITGLYKTTEREQIYAYSESYMKDPVAIITAKKNPFFFSGWEMLIGKQGGATLGDSYGQAFDTFMKNNLDVERVSSYKQLFKLLQEGRIEYGVGPLHTLKAHMKREKFEQSIQIQQHLVVTEKLYMAMPKKSSCLFLLEPINQQIRKMKLNGQIDQMVEAAILKWSQS